MTNKWTILVVDRNPHVRDYLKRELEHAGYCTFRAENCRELFFRLKTPCLFDLIVIDPDLPDMEEEQLFQNLQSLHPQIPVVIHTFIANYLPWCNVLIQAEFVEKDGNSIEKLKAAIGRHLYLSPLPSSHLSFPLTD